MYHIDQTIETIRTGNKFIVRKMLGGGMGYVYVARRVKDKKDYALKTPRNKKREALIQFRRESLVWIILGKHQNIVQAYWFDLDTAYCPFLVMDYVKGVHQKGVSIGEWRARQGKLPLRLSLNFTIQAITGLLYAKETINKELGIPFIHRDIKPDNLLIEDNETIKVTDFGLVKSFTGLDRIGGTYHYMAPEQWYGEEIDEKTDIYALGCTLYEMIKGSPPFLGISEEDFKKQHLYEIPKRLSELPSGLAMLIDSTLRKDPSERPGLHKLRFELLKVYQHLFNETIRLKDEPESLTAEELNARGVAFDQLGRHKKAIECYNQAITLCADDPRFYVNLANSLVILKDLESAEKNYQIALNLFSQMLEPIIGLGNLFFLKGNKKGALKCYQKACELNPDEPMTYVALGNFYARQNEYKKARALFIKALSKRKGVAEAYFGIGNLYFCVKDYPKAIEYYNITLSHNLLYREAYLNLARVYQLVNEPKKRDDMISKIVAFDLIN